MRGLLEVAGGGGVVVWEGASEAAVARHLVWRGSRDQLLRSTEEVHVSFWCSEVRESSSGRRNWTYRAEDEREKVRRTLEQRLWGKYKHWKQTTKKLYLQPYSTQLSERRVARRAWKCRNLRFCLFKLTNVVRTVLSGTPLASTCIENIYRHNNILDSI